MAKRSTVSAKDVANTFYLLGLLISLAVFIILIPFKIIYKIMDSRRYKREYRDDLLELKALVEKQQVRSLDKDSYAENILDSKEELYKIYHDVQWLEERVTGYKRRRNGFRVSNYGFYEDNSYTQQESIKDLVVLRTGRVYLTDKRIVMYATDKTIKELKYKDIAHVDTGKRTLLFSKKSGGKAVLLRFKVSVFTAKALIVGFWPNERNVLLPPKVIADMSKLEV